MASLRPLRQARDRRERHKAAYEASVEEVKKLVLQQKGEVRSKEVAEAAGLADQTVRNLWWRADS